ncbi:unnamed protein product [Rotaria sp. Silwood2]|nr:unnamed protein product [Rotaria sp. Silwood2]
MAALQQHWKNLSVSLADAIFTISMNRPKVNAMSFGLLTDLEQAFDHASKIDHIKGVHLRSGLGLSDMHERCVKRHRPTIDKFVFDTISRGATVPLCCSKPVACSLDGHALACDYIAIGTRKAFRISVTELAVGVPFPTIPFEIMRH